MSGKVYALPGDPRTFAFLREIDDFGHRVVQLVPPSSRFYGDDLAQQPDRGGLDHLDARRVTELPSPSRLLGALPGDDNWLAMSRRSQARLLAWFLVSEDPQRRMEAKEIQTLAHQASLVHHIIGRPELTRVLIADEVGLGKTLEAGLICQEVLRQNPGWRVLYLAPARLTRNVRREFKKLGLRFKLWVAGSDKNADLLEDNTVIASIHKAAVKSNFNHVAGTSWDLVVVDECHHLSDWADGGGKPNRQYALAKKLLESGQVKRAILMSGTPHQGNQTLLENLLDLLRAPKEPKSAVAGRVIYRTKEDVRDWEGRPLFPKRHVKPPLVFDLQAAYRGWLEDIHEFYVPSRRQGSKVRQRAAGWRYAQALQWATSSVHAGLGYLVRQALRLGWTLDRPSLREALCALRPYRGGHTDEDPANLFERLLRDIGQQDEEEEIEDMEEKGEEEDRWEADPEQLRTLLLQGVGLLQSEADRKWEFIAQHLLDPAGDEKVVLFAQPVETVTALCHFLKRRYGQVPALIIGNQSDAEREEQVRRFWSEGGPRFLVSSRAGGEGINLQVAWRIVHVDVPWNPMEMEQRVGRVHRFGSRRTIQVDTVVVKDSREVRAYEVARERLKIIARDLVSKDPSNDEKFEMIFSRVMALVPPSELMEVIGQAQPMTPLSEENSRRISEVVTQGFEGWQEFNARFIAQQRQIRDMDPGLARWEDLALFAREYLDAEPVAGFRGQHFREQAGEFIPEESDAQVLRIGDGLYHWGDYGGVPITGPKGERPQALGLNTPVVARELRKLGVTGAISAGAAHLRWPTDEERPRALGELPCGVLVIARQTVGRYQEELDLGLAVFLVRSDGSCEALRGADKGQVLRGLVSASPRSKPEEIGQLLGHLQAQEDRLALELRRPSEVEFENGRRHATLPLMSAVLWPGDGRRSGARAGRGEAEATGDATDVPEVHAFTVYHDIARWFLAGQKAQMPSGVQLEYRDFPLPAGLMRRLGYAREGTSGWRRDAQLPSSPVPVAIHAGKNDTGEAEWSAEGYRRRFGGEPPAATPGHIVAMAEIVACEEEDGAWAWHVANVRPLRPSLPCKGWLRLWKVPPELSAQLSAPAALTT